MIEQGLDVKKIALEIEIIIDYALKQFPVPNPIVNSYPEAEQLLGNFYRYLMNSFFGANINDTMARGFISLLIQKTIGVENAADMAVHGLNRGVLGLLDTVADTVKKQLVDQHVEGIITSGVDIASFDDKTQLALQYVRKYGMNLNSGNARKTAQELAPHVPALMKNHMKIAGTFRQILGK